MDVTLYNFSKKENSTKRPVGGTSKDGVLKGPCSTTHPTIDFQTINNPASYNYAYIPSFSRYYYIEEWVNNGALWTARMSVDVLATYKPEIGSTSLYILRAAADYDGGIIDNVFPALHSSSSTVSGTNPWALTFGEGSYVVGVVGGGGSIGAVSYYVFDQTQFNTFKSVLFGSGASDIFFGDLGEFTQDFVKCNYNPFQYVVSVQWFPFKVPTSGGVGSLPFGWWNLSGVSCSNLTTATCYQTFLSISMDAHPQSGERGTFCNLSPFTKRTLYFPPFGSVPLDTTFFQADYTLNLQVNVDLITGAGCLFVENGSADRISEVFAQIGVPVQLAQMSTDVLSTTASAVSTGLSTAGDIITGNVAGAVSNLVNGAISTYKASLPSFQTSGTNGGTAALRYAPSVTSQFFELATDDLENLGRPCYKKASPGSLGGYMVVQNGDVLANGTKQELSEIKGYLEGGFYYE